MAPSAFLKFLLLTALLCRLCSGNSDFDAVKVPVTEFVGSIRSTMSIIRQVISTVSQFAGLLGDFRTTNAVNDCLDLMDFSMDQLSWTISASQNPHGKDNSTGNVKSDMKTWLSGALINQDTCKEGLDDTNSLVASLVSGTLDQVSSLIYNILVNVNPTNGGNGKGSGRKLIGNDDLPNWLNSRDRNLLQSAPNGAAADAVVALDGTGNYGTIKEAVDAAPEFSSKRYVIYIKRGVYKEYVEIGKKKWNVMMIGDGIDATVITGDRNFIDGWTTYRSATFAVKGQGFIAMDITFENTAGPAKHQAVAYRSDSDLSVVYRCRIRGFQDTLYAHSQRQFYRDCQISGTVDFIFGDGAVVFQKCNISARQGLSNQKNTITAQGRKESVENTGFSIQFCNIVVEPDMMNSTQTYLGRPWKQYSRTVILQSYISNAIRPQGWLEWNGDFALATLFYGEYMNYGPGAGLGSRVNWPGFRVLNTSAEASNFTVSQFIIGDSWLPSTGVKYTAGLLD